MKRVFKYVFPLHQKHVEHSNTMGCLVFYIFRSVFINFTSLDSLSNSSIWEKQVVKCVIILMTCPRFKVWNQDTVVFFFFISSLLGVCYYQTFLFLVKKYIKHFFVVGQGIQELNQVSKYEQYIRYLTVIMLGQTIHLGLIFLYGRLSFSF